MRIARKTLARVYRRVAPLGLSLVYAFDVLARRLITPAAPDPGRVLIVKPDGIGDFVMGLPMLTRLREVYPAGKFRLTLLGNQAWSALAEQQGLFEEVWPLNVRRFKRSARYRWGMVKRLRLAGFQTVINPIYSRAYHEDVAVAATGAPERLGCVGDACNVVEWLKRRTDRWYTRLLGDAGAQPMELVRQAAFLHELGAADALATLPRLNVPPGPRPEALAALPPDKPYFVLVPGAGMSWKCWPADRLGAVAHQITTRTGWTGVVCGGPAEADAAAALVTTAAAQGTPLVNALGRTPLPDLVRLIAAARLVLGNDTGALHIAAGVGTPSVCVLGGGHYGRFFPYQVEHGDPRTLPLTVIHRMDCYGCNWECIYRVRPGDAFPCIQGVTVEAVMAEVDRVLAAAKR